MRHLVLIAVIATNLQAIGNAICATACTYEVEGSHSGFWAGESCECLVSVNFSAVQQRKFRASLSPAGSRAREYDDRALFQYDDETE